MIKGWEIPNLSGEREGDKRTDNARLQKFLTDVLQIQVHTGEDVLEVVAGEHYLNMGEVAKLLGGSKDRVRESYKRGDLSGYRIPKKEGSEWVQEGGARMTDSTSVLNVMINTGRYCYLNDNHPDVLKKYEFPVVQR